MKALAAILLWLAAAGAAALPPVQTRELLLDGHRVTLDVHATAGTPGGAAILSHGFTRRKLPIVTVRSWPKPAIRRKVSD